jgi:hypothetical protein
MKNSMEGAAKLLAFFRLLDEKSFDETMQHFYEKLTDGKEKAVYHEVFARAVECADQNTGNA